LGFLHLNFLGGPVYRSDIIALLVAYCVEIAVLFGLRCILAACSDREEGELVSGGKATPLLD
jgi:hypothetical protein